MTLERRRTARRIPRKTGPRKKVSVGYGNGMFLWVSREALAAGLGVSQSSLVHLPLVQYAPARCLGSAAAPEGTEV